MQVATITKPLPSLHKIAERAANTKGDIVFPNFTDSCLSAMIFHTVNKCYIKIHTFNI